jgi:hypothetical protein
MNAFLRSLLTSSFLRPFELNEVRHLATWVSGLALAWLMGHHAQQSDAMNIAQGLGSIIVGGAGYLMSQLNDSNTETRVQASALTGQVLTTAEAKAVLAQGVAQQRGADQAQADATSAAIARAAAEPKTDADVDQAIKDHDV